MKPTLLSLGRSTLLALACALLAWVLPIQAQAQAASPQDLQAEVSALLKSQTQQIGGGDEGASKPRIEVILGQLDPRLKLAPCDKVRTYLPPGTRMWGKARVGMRCEQGPVRWNVYWPITVKVWAPAVVAVTVAAPAPSVNRSPEQRKQDSQRRQQLTEQLRPLKKELEQNEKRTAALSQQKNQLEARLSQPANPKDMADAGRELKAVNDQIEALELRWLDLTEQIEGASGLDDLYPALFASRMTAGWHKKRPSLWKEPRTEFRPLHWRYELGKAALDQTTLDDLVERVTRQVLERLSDRVVRDTVSDIVSRVSERLVRDEIERGLRLMGVTKIDQLTPERLRRRADFDRVS